MSGFATQTDLADKVDKVEGKGLSENDYTDAEKDKVALLSSDSAVVDARLADALVGQPDSIVLQVKRKSGSTTTINEFDLASYYVQKEQGKGLSTNDFTDEDKNAVRNAIPLGVQLALDRTQDMDTIRSGAAAGATAYQKPPTGIPATDLASAVQTSLGKADTALQSQEQADWNEADSSDPAYIKNKPTVPDAQVQANWNESDSASKAYIQNKPSIPAAQVNSD